MDSSFSEIQNNQGFNGASPKSIDSEVEDTVPVDYNCAKLVQCITDLSNTEFSAGYSAIVHPRKLEGNFNGLARQMSRDVAAGSLRGKKFHNAWLLLDDVREYAENSEGFKDELESILSDMEYLKNLGRSPMLKVYTYDYEDDTVDLPHVDPYTPNYDTDEKYDDRYICVFNSKVTRHASYEDVETENKSFGSDITTFRLKQGAEPRRFSNGDIWRQACGVNTSTKGLIHWSGTEMSDGPKLILTA